MKLTALSRYRKADTFDLIGVLLMFTLLGLLGFMALAVTR